MSQDEFGKLPEQVEVREIHLLIQQKGFRSKEIIIPLLRKQNGFLGEGYHLNRRQGLYQS